MRHFCSMVTHARVPLQTFTSCGRRFARLSVELRGMILAHRNRLTSGPFSDHERVSGEGCRMRHLPKSWAEASRAG
jgi:hypothetical protein